MTIHEAIIILENLRVQQGGVKVQAALTLAIMSLKSKEKKNDR